MADEQVIDIPGLSGEEIIVDACEQLAAKLRMDCNLRGSDSYINGYSAEIKVKIRCYGIDTAEVDNTVVVSKTPAVKTAGKEKVTEAETELTIAHEPDLQAVRDRSEQVAPEVENRPPDPVADAIAKSGKRRYGSVAPKAAAGGAGDEDLSE